MPAPDSNDSFDSGTLDSLDLPSPARDFGRDLASDGLSLDGGAFGEIDLPMASDPSSRKAGERDPLGLDSPLDPAFGNLPSVRPTKSQPAPPPSNPFEQAFSLPELDAQSAAPRSTSFSASFPGFDTSKTTTKSDPAPSSDVARNSSSPPSSGFGELDDSMGDGGDFAEGPALEHGPASKRRKGGAQYGEVDLGGGDDFDDFDSGRTGLDTDDGMEFGAIPQETTSADGAEVATAPSSASIPAAKPNQAAASAVVRPAHPGQAFEIAQDKKKRWVVPLAALLTVGIAGGALALLPDVGPYGFYFFSDLINEGDYERTLAKQHEALVEARAADTLKASSGALSQVDSKRKSMPRFRPLSAYLAFAQYAHILRFGGDSEMQAKAKVQLDSVLESGVDPAVVELRAAQAVGKAVAGDLEAAREALERLTQSRSKDVELWAAQGEVQLSLGDAKAAKATWQHALELQNSAWTLFGLARAQHELGESEAASASATAVLQKNAEHIGAKLLLAELAWTKKDETQATQFLDEVIAKEGVASRGELLQARTLAAEIHFGRGRLSKAEAEFEAALKLDPKSYRALAGLGDTFFEAGRYTAALARYEAAVSSDDKAIRAKLGIARSQLFLEKVADAQVALLALQKDHPKDATVAYWLARSAEVAGKRDIAKGAYEVAIAEGGAGPDAARSYVALAQLLRQEGALDDAAKLLTEASSKLPDSSLLRKALGDVALSQGRYQQALDEFRAARKLDDADVGALFSIGVCQRKLGQFEEALKTFDEVAAFDKDLPGLPLERGLLLEQSGKTQEALAEYESALERAPDDPDLMLRVGCARVAAQDAKAAQSILEKVLEKRPRLAEAHHCLGRAYFEAEKYIEALQSLRRSTELDPNRAEYFVYVAWVANAAGQVALAEQAVDTALSKDQGLGDAYWQKGVLLLRQGAALDAVHSFDKALELRPSRYEVHADLAQAYYQLGDELKALREWEQALKHDDSDPTWQYRYGKLLAARRMNREALPHLQKAIALAEAKEVKPPWLWQAHQLLASTLGPSSAALPHWRKFLEQSPENSPYRDEAKRALARAGQAWTGP